MLHLAKRGDSAVQAGAFFLVAPARSCCFQRYCGGSRRRLSGASTRSHRFSFQRRDPGEASLATRACRGRRQRLLKSTRPAAPWGQAGVGNSERGPTANAQRVGGERNSDEFSARLIRPNKHGALWLTTSSSPAFTSVRWSKKWSDSSTQAAASSIP